MTLDYENDALPLTTDHDGVVRVGRTRVTLDTVLGAFAEGATTEEIALQYPSLDLAASTPSSATRFGTGRKLQHT